jgi:RNA recognition motif-containing protein
MADEETAVTTTNVEVSEAVEVTTTDVTVRETVRETVTVEEETAVTDNEHTKTEEENENKVFVGNLAFQTTESELSEFFGKTGKVVKANIITRGTRSLGYGFVALETKEDADKVIAELNRQELGGRSINVEAAKPKTDSGPPSFHASRRGRGRYHMHGRVRGRGRGHGRGGRGRGRGGWRGRRRFSSRNDDPSAPNDTTAPTDTMNANGTHDDNIHKTGRSSYRSRRGGRGRGRGRGRFSSRRRPNSSYAAGAVKTGDPSKTIVFVANLPFSVNDDGLKDIFKDYQVKSAHVVRRRGGRSKGFGFVELVDENEQKNALEGLKSVQSEGRELVIKVALSDQQAHVDEEKAGGEEVGETNATAAGPAANEEPKKEEETANA